MVVEVSTGNGFRSTISYVHKEHEKDLPKNKKPEVIEKNLVFGNTPEMARQMRFVSNANSRISKPVMHVSISFDAKERISEEQRQKAVQSVLKEMGVKSLDHQYLIVKHNDTANPHYHIVLNKVDLDGKKLNLGFDGKKEEFIKNRLQVIADKIEQEQGLKRTEGRNIVYDANSEKAYRFLSKEEKSEQKSRNKKAIREKNPNKREQQTAIKNEVSKVLQDKKLITADDFKQTLASKGIDVRFANNKNGIYGVSFKTDKISVKASQIGVKWGDINKILIANAKGNQEKNRHDIEMENKAFNRNHIQAELKKALQNPGNVNLYDLKKDLENKGMTVHLSTSGTERENNRNIFNLKINDNSARDLGSDINSIKDKLQENKNNLIKTCFNDEKNTSIYKLKEDLESKGFKIDLEINPYNNKTASYFKINDTDLSPSELIRVNKLINLNNTILENKPIDNFDKQVFRLPNDQEQQENKRFERINEYRGAVIQEYNQTMMETTMALKRNPNISLETLHIDKFFEKKGYLLDKEADTYILKKEGKILDEISRSDFTGEVSKINTIKLKYIQDLDSYNKLQQTQNERIPLIFGRKEALQRNKDLDHSKQHAQKPVFNVQIKPVDQEKYIKISSYDQEKKAFQNLVENEMKKSMNAQKLIAEKKEILAQFEVKKAPQRQNKYTLGR